mgnify:CR=1 FL=1
MKIIDDINALGFEDLANCYDDLYFRAQNIRLKQYRDYAGAVELHITDLTNALKPGKDVTHYIFKGPMWEVLFFTYDEPVSSVLERLYRQKVRGVEYRTRTLKSMRVFSPFVKAKPLTPPSKWTLQHVWKAILAGQITAGRTDLYLTDDYAWDNATNFGRGEVDIMAFARKIIEHPDGWRVRIDREDERRIFLRVHCHSFDYKTLVFAK